jgi:hypothetical protein
MPLATNPKALFEIVLESDNELPEGERPVFIYHYLTGLEQIELTNLLEKKEKDPKRKSKDVIEESFKAATMGLVGWRNVFDRSGESIAFASEQLYEIMGFREATELAWKVLNEQILSPADKKKSDGPSKSNMGKSAKGAKARKNAPTG